MEKDFDKNLIGDADLNPLSTNSDKESKGMFFGPKHPIFKKKKEDVTFPPEANVDPIVPPDLEDYIGKTGDPDPDNMKQSEKRNFF